ncbi:transcriptional regulator [Deltaproteobacteria bacterium Smac51]|nr:transcriptional regulator [Deltaproteobacteria bacterium Smac51]
MMAAKTNVMGNPHPDIVPCGPRTRTLELMMTELMSIQPFIQSYVLAISSIIDAAVTVVDRRLIRVGGTGEYLGQIGRTVPHDSFFRRILSEGTPGIIRDVRREFVCHVCENSGNCRELANLAYPVFLRGQVVGIIAIIAFEAAERKRLLSQRVKLENFLKHMSDLLESKIITSEDNQTLARQVSEIIDSKNRDGFVGESAAARSLRRFIEKIGPGDSTVLISGESGTGKEVAAQMIHAAGPRGQRLMVSVNCAAIPEQLLESELFGYEKGAFTGARKEGHAGKFELADHSTIFLDEIGDMPLTAQTRLLRVLQERTVERVGGSRAIPIDVRVICATNRSLPELVEKGLFREDLFFRLNVIPVKIPPLRERRDDIPILVDHWLKHFRQKRKNELTVESSVYQALIGYGWPGNVRELKNLVEYLTNMVEGAAITPADLPEHLLMKSDGGWSGQALADIMNEYERRLLSGLLAKLPASVDKEELAQRLSISRATLYRKLEKHGLL